MGLDYYDRKKWLASAGSARGWGEFARWLRSTGNPVLAAFADVPLVDGDDLRALVAALEAAPKPTDPNVAKSLQVALEAARRVKRGGPLVVSDGLE